MYIYTEHSPQAPISLRFALRSLVFQIIDVFLFPIDYNGEFQIFVKNQKLKISKIQKQYFCETYWEENSGDVSKYFLLV